MYTLLAKRAVILWLLGVFLLSLLCIVPQFSRADILFEDDFEGGKLDPKKWNPKAEWQIIAPDPKLKSLGKGVLDFSTGEANITIKNDFKDFVYEADFRAMNAGKITGFVFRAQDGNSNFYMHQISADGSAHTPNNMRWHWKVGGNWNVEPIPFLKGEKVMPEVWYRARFIIEGFNFKSYVLETEEFEKNPRNAKMRQLGDWIDKSKSYAKGAIGFRASGGEHMQYDNVLVYDIGFDPFSVDLAGKLATTWGKLKTKQ